MIIIISLAVVLLIGFLIEGSLLIKNKTTEQNKNEDTDEKVASTITLDINPSIKLELDKDEYVINVISLNNSAKAIIEGDYKGKKLNEAIEKITNNLINKGYAEEKLIILVGVYGKVNEEKVKELINNKLTEKEVEHDIIIPEISDIAREMAKKYNITESKASYIEEITKKYSEIKAEELKDMEIKDIINKTTELEKATEEKIEENNVNNGNSNSYGGGSGSLEKCDYVNSALTNEEAGKKVASLMGASVGTGKYCDKLAPESVVALSPDGTCVYKVTFAHRTQSCVYYIGVETGNIIGNPSCTSKLVEEGEAQCIVMDSMGITKREQSGIIKNIDGGSEWIYEVEDMYGTPDEEGKQYVYECHVSKYTGQITSKTAIRELQ